MRCRLLKNLYIKNRSYRSFVSQCRSLHGFQTLLFICNQFGCFVAIDSESVQRLFLSFCMLTFEVTVLFNWNLSTLPFLGQIVNLDLLVCTGFDLEYADLFLCLCFFIQRPMYNWRIDKSYECCFGRYQVSAKPFKNFLQIKKSVSDLSLPKIYKAFPFINWQSLICSVK